MEEILRTLDTNVRKIESSLQKQVDGSHLNLRAIVTSNNTSSTIGDIKPEILAFVRYKNDTRFLLNYLRDNFAASPYELERMDIELAEFDTMFENFHSLPLREQYVKIASIVSLRDEAMGRISVFLLDEMNIEHDSSTAEERLFGEELKDMTSKELNKYHILFSNFRILGKSVKKFIVDKNNAEAEKDVDMDVQAKDILIASLRDKVAVKDHEIEDLQNKLDTIYEGAGRMQTISKQISTIQSLESQVREKDKAIAAAAAVQHTQKQQILALRDTIALRETQLKKARESYANDIVKLRPLVEEQANQANAALKEVFGIRNEVSLSKQRLVEAEKKTKQYQDRMEKQTTEMGRILKLLNDRIQLHKRSEEKRARQERINYVVVAAKLKYENLSISFARKIKQLNANIDDLNAILEATRSEMGDMDAYILELQDLTEKEAKNKFKLEEKVKICNEKLAMKDLRYAKLQDQMDILAEEGITESKKAEWKALQKQLAKHEADLITAQKKNRDLEYKIYTLQAEVMNLKLEKM